MSSGMPAQPITPNTRRTGSTFAAVAASIPDVDRISSAMSANTSTKAIASPCTVLRTT
jgi:hypothetical protein